MTYQVLARKWRPKDFASLVGQEHVVRALTHALDGGRLHHAYLFTGTRGVGKTTLSRIFAKALNCETGVTATPCGVCRACREIDEGRFVDYVEMDAASNRGVDEMAALLERAVYAPVDARFKVYMIDEVHMLTNHAFNAMLKTLEEPPPHVKFILATTDPQKIPVTVLSRCLQFNLKQMPAGHIVSHLERILGEEQIAFEAQALRLLSRAADGSMRDALSLTDQAIAYSANQVTEEAVRGMLGALDQSYLIRLLDALAANDGPAVLAVADEMALRSLSFSTALQDLASLLHRIGWAQFAPSSVLDEWPEAGDVRRFADALSPEQVQLFYQIATIGRSELGLAPDEYAGFTMTLLRMLAFEPAANGGGGAAGGGPASAARPGGQQSGAGGGRRAGAPAVTAQQTVVPQAPTPRRTASADAQEADVAFDAANVDVGSAAADQTAAMREPAHEARGQQAVSVPAGASNALSGGNADSAETAVRRGTLAAHATGASTPARAEAPTPSVSGSENSEGAESGARTAGVDADAGATPSAGASAAVEPVPVPAASAAAVQQRFIDAAAQAQDPEPAPTSSSTQPSTQPADGAPRRGGGASAALDVLRNAGMKLAGGGSRPNASASAVPAKAAPVPPKPAAPRVAVPTPEPARRAQAQAQQQDNASSRAASSRAGAKAGAGSSATVPPWEDIPPDAAGALDDYVPMSADDAFFAPPDDGFAPVFDSGANDLRVSPAAAPAPAVDTRPLPPAVPLDTLGFHGDWPALAAGLPLKGISYQLAFNSELMALDGTTLKLNVPVPQYADAAQVAKLKAALAERLGRSVEVVVEVGPARRTAAALDAAARAQRQQEAEREIGADPFVQSLIREFGASIVPGSIRPLMPAAQGGAGGASAAH
ncbi:DNA polymerase III subunit gamma/tau [Paraburkholderia sp. SARCC-3016]|uniref:DNA polymerase III subunit gamma/tau n=1 Tax=Paraburkholderia sp. SARCC-3016 TaxID=3058611 RepID=UPI00280A4271|nr:DNA polymerase III subunit gamma/tau [Paraburkholderia sp. SARCC-3016]MDQ7977459.1 DNA polymerase III subunit gamma/tau [Paraburkholderia sp. SARCC-3016]